MNDLIKIKSSAIIKMVSNWEERHPYHVSFLISLLIISILLFNTSFTDITGIYITPIEKIEFLNLAEVNLSKRFVKKRIAASPGSISKEVSNMERSIGVSDESNAVDLSFHLNQVPPKLIGKLKRNYPEIAAERNIEAVLSVEILININGKVKNVQVIDISLSKTLQPEVHAKLSKEFIREARRSLFEAKFTPPIVNGKKVPVKMESIIKFKL